MQEDYEAWRGTCTKTAEFDSGVTVSDQHHGPRHRHILPCACVWWDVQ